MRLTREERQALIGAILNEAFDRDMHNPAFQGRAALMHQAANQSGGGKGRFNFQGRKYSTKTTGGQTVIKRRFLGGLIKRKVGSVGSVG